MKEEIKEILEALKPHDKEFTKVGLKEYPLVLSVKEQKILLDYITNLQEENKRINNIIDEIDNKLCSTWQLYYDHSRLTTFKCEDMLYLIEQIRKDINELKGE